MKTRTRSVWQFTLALLGMAIFCQAGEVFGQEAEKEPAEETIEKVDPRALPTHQQVRVIEPAKDDEVPIVHTFCLGGDGNLLVGCGGNTRRYTVGEDGKRKLETVEQQPQVRQVSPQGECLSTWDIDFSPKAIGMTDDGTIYVGGDGMMAVLGSQGKVLRSVEAPNLKTLAPTREQVVAMIAQQMARVSLQDVLKEVNEKTRAAATAEYETPEARNEAIAKVRTEVLALYRKESEKLPEKAAEIVKQYANPSPEQLEEIEEKTQQLVESARSRSSATSITIDGDDVYLAARGSSGYSVWRMNRDLGDVERIVDRLSGCCGQMCVYAHDGELFVAENGRHRVGRYDRDGKEVAQFGERARAGIEGFGSCCNPMNVCFGPGGKLYTAESTTGRIKRYQVDGELIGLAGNADITSGCKHVAVAVSPDGSEVYVLDYGKQRIVVLSNEIEEAKDQLADTAG